MRRLFTSESVTEGHPDKICDQISDAILDDLLRQDPQSRVACETAVNTGFVLVMGEITTEGNADIQQIVRSTIADIGFTDGAMGFDAASCGILTSIDEQSPDIALGVNKALEAKQGGDDEYGAGDQGMMFGYACDETEDYMPMPIELAHRLTKQLATVRKEGQVDYLCPDGKSQVTVEYDGDTPVRIDTVVLSTQHRPWAENEKLRQDMIELVVKPILPKNMIDNNTRFFINPTGRFVVGGPQGDSGLTGRKIIVDSYGGYARHGGGAFSGKDPTKVDRSAAYAARYAAKNLVAAGLAKKCEIELAYAIGVAQPVGIFVETFGTGKVSDEKLGQIVQKVFDFRPGKIIEKLDLRRPIYKQVAAYGHFGRADLDLPWERLDMVDALKEEI